MVWVDCDMLINYLYKLVFNLYGYSDNILIVIHSSNLLI